MLAPCNFYWYRIDNKHMTEPWLDQALMESVYKSATSHYLINTHSVVVLWKIRFPSKIEIKGTVDVFSSDPRFTSTWSDSQRYRWRRYPYSSSWKSSSVKFKSTLAWSVQWQSKVKGFYECSRTIPFWRSF